MRPRIPAVLSIFFLLFLFSPFRSSKLFLTHAQALSQLKHIREGYVFVRSTGSTRLSLHKSDGVFDGWDTELLIKKPNGYEEKTFVWKDTQPAASETLTLPDLGDYQIIPRLPFSVFDFSSSDNKIVLETNKQKRTFRDISSSHAETKLYFFVPNNTSQFTFYGMVSRGDNTQTREVKLYKPDGSIYKTLVPDVAEGSWKSIVVHSPVSGYWSASILAKGTVTEGGYWVDGIPNYFSPSPTSWFKPQFSGSTITFEMSDDKTFVDRGTIGADRLGKSGSLSPMEVQAYNEIGFEANEVEIGQKFRERTNDNSDPFSLNLGAYDFSNTIIDDTVNILHSQPINFLSNPADWLLQKSSLYPACAQNTTNISCLNDATVQDEYVETMIAILTQYLKEKKYDIHVWSILEEPDRQGLNAVSVAKIFNKAMQRVRNSSIPNASTLFLTPGSISSNDNDAKTYLKTVLDNIKPEYIKFIAIHPWQFGFPGYGNIYSTTRIRSDILELTAYAESKGGSANKKVIISGLSPRYGSQDYNLKSYFDSFDNALWLWSSVVNIISTRKSASVLFSPFMEDGTISGQRGFVNSDGSLKPSGFAAKFLMSNLRQKVLQIKETQNKEVEILATVDQYYNRLNFSVVNKAPRVQNVNIKLPSYLTKPSNLLVQKIDRTQYSSPIKVAGTLSNDQVSFTMDPESLYNISVDVSLSSSSASVTNSPNINACVADINLDKVVNLTDYSLLTQDFLKTTHLQTVRSDINTDGKVDLKDYSMLVRSFLETCK